MEFDHPNLEPVYFNESEVVRNLVLIGNGFDLSHGLKTSYKDFFTYVVKRYISGSDKIIERKNILDSHSLGNFESIKSNIDYLKSDNELLFYLIKNLGESERWVDLEWIYYQLLTKLLEKSDATVTKLSKKYNTDLENIKKHLIAYLKEEIIPKIPKIEIRSSVTEGIFGTKRQYKNIYCLNFNYTPTLLRYRNPTWDFDFQLNYIHGFYDEDLENIIFGFGDDYHPLYSEIENRNLNDFFKNFKSFNYLRRKRYHELIQWIGLNSIDNKFIVTILGHSCGITDRTLLRYIFEHENCVSIKPYYHQWSEIKQGRELLSDNYTEISYEISRQFTNNVEFRNKMKNFEDCSSI